MQQSRPILNLVSAASTVCVLLSGCSGPQPAVIGGDSASVQVRYAGNVATATPLAAAHCARFERAARLVDAGDDVASFACVRQ